MQSRTGAALDRISTTWIPKLALATVRALFDPILGSSCVWKGASEPPRRGSDAFPNPWSNAPSPTTAAAFTGAPHRVEGSPHAEAQAPPRSVRARVRSRRRAGQAAREPGRCRRPHPPTPNPTPEKPTPSSRQLPVVHTPTVRKPAAVAIAPPRTPRRQGRQVREAPPRRPLRLRRQLPRLGLRLLRLRALRLRRTSACGSRHSSFAQFTRGIRVSRGALKPGDLVFFDGPGPRGHLRRGGRFIHAPHTGSRVRIESLRRLVQQPARRCAPPRRRPRLAELLGHRREQLPRDRGIALDERPEIPRRHAVAEHVGAWR